MPLLKNIALLLASLAVALLLAEGLLALFLPQGKLNIVAENIFFVEHDTELGWRNRPDAEGIWRPNPGAPPVYVRINSLGLRGREMPLEKPPGAKRVLVLGDSVAFGYGVEEEGAFPGRLAGDFDVVNTAVVGWGTDQELLFLARDGMGFRPDVVVVGFTPGDVQDNMSSFVLNYPKPYFRLTDRGMILQGVPVPEKVNVGESHLRDRRAARLLYEHSHLGRLLLNRLYTGRLRLDNIEEMSREEGLWLTIALLGAIKEECGGAGCELLVLLLPNGKWLRKSVESGAREGFYDILIRMLERNGLRYIDPHVPLLEAMSSGEALFLPGDPVHLNERGHEIVARELRKAL